MSQIALEGRKFGRLTVIKYEYSKNYKRYWLCKCECGNEKYISTSKLTTGNTISCGCYQKENIKNGLNYKHGLRKTRLYRIWVNMKTRCCNTNDNHFKDYGARGIKICDEWLNDFMNFYNWSMENGYKDNLTIDRIDVNGNYEPSNCRWATILEQNRNRRVVKVITFNGKSQTISQWSSELKLGKETIRERIKKGWTIEECLFGKKKVIK